MPIYLIIMYIIGIAIHIIYVYILWIPMHNRNSEFIL